MTITTNVPQPTLTSYGYTLPDTSSILTGVQQDFSAAFGATINMDLDTPQGQLMSSITAIIDDSYNLFLEYVNNVDPQYSQGRMQDAIGRIYFMTRIAATSTTVVARCTGLEGTVIPSGAQAQDTSGNIYQTTGSNTIPAQGYVDITFSAVETGPLTCPVGTLTKIYGALPGWDTINNLVAGTPGRDVETSQEFEYRRSQSVSAYSQGTLAAVYAAVAASGADLPSPTVPSDVYVTENVAATSKTVGGVVLLPHSLYVCVAGGDPDSIAYAIWSKGSLGCNYTGDTTIEIEDESYDEPRPTYEVSYQTAANLSIYTKVTLGTGGTVDATTVSRVQTAVYNSFYGLDGSAKVRIGAKIYASKFYSAIAAVVGSVPIVSIKVGLTSSPAPSSDYLSVNIDKYPYMETSYVSVVGV